MAPCRACEKIAAFLDLPLTESCHTSALYLSDTSGCHHHIALIQWAFGDSQALSDLVPHVELAVNYSHRQNSFFSPDIGPHVELALHYSHHQDSLFFSKRAAWERKDSGAFHALRWNGDEDGGRHGSSARVIDPSWIDTALFRHWKENCDLQHGSKCRILPLSLQATSMPAWVIDVEENRLVKPKAQDTYCALSYVWGLKKFFVTLKDNLEQNQQPYAFSKHDIDPPVSRTILDAMEVVRQLGERYLWADALVCL